MFYNACPCVERSEARERAETVRGARSADVKYKRGAPPAPRCPLSARPARGDGGGVAGVAMEVDDDALNAR